MPLPLIGFIIGALGALTVTGVVIATLFWHDIINWFRARNDLKQSDNANIAFTIQENLRTGNFRTIQGVFNKRTNDLKDSRVVESENIDYTVRNKHKNESMVLYD